jgi:hypothetical protein
MTRRLSYVTEKRTKKETRLILAGIARFSGQAGVRTVTSSFRENVFRAGLNYKWGG